MSEDYRMFFIEKYNEIGQLFLRLEDYKNDPRADIDTEFIWQLINVIDKCITVAEGIVEMAVFIMDTLLRNYKVQNQF